MKGEGVSSVKKRQRVVVLGAGFGGMELCKRLRAPNTDIVLVDRRNHHLFQPLLYQVATAALSAPEISQPVRFIFSKRKDITVFMDEVIHVDPSRQKVILGRGELDYDYLVVALGARPNYFGNDHWERYAPPLKSLDDAALIRRDVLYAFERAETTDDVEERRRLMTIAIVGGGPTGVELAGAFAELARTVLQRDFQHIDPTQARVVLIEALDRILPTFPEELSDKAAAQLRRLNVEIVTGSMVQDIRKGEIEINGGVIPAENVIWTAGVRAGPIVEDFGVETDKAGRLKVNPDLSLPGHPNIFAIGDLVHLTDADGTPVPGLAPAAMQMARHVAAILKKELVSQGRADEARPAFRYRDKGLMATVGRNAAVARIGRMHLSGWAAWLAWLFVHLITMIGLRNKLAVILQWVYAYVISRRGARIIWGHERFQISSSHSELEAHAKKREDSE